jgi:MFS family permease
MIEGIFSSLHLLTLLFLAVILFGIPLLLVFLLARWLDKRLRGRPNVRVSFVGVASGGITDVVSSSLLAAPLVVYLVVKFDHLHGAERSAAIASSIHSSAWLYGLQLTVGLACSALGGYVAAWIAKHDELLNGLLSSFLCVAIGIYSVFSNKDSQSVLVQVGLLVASPAFALLGGYLRHSQKRRVGHTVTLRPTVD